MQTTTDINRAAPNRQRKAGRRGWIAFMIGMAAMFALLAVWVVLVEMGGAHGSEASPLMSQDACRGGATSVCR